MILILVLVILAGLLWILDGILKDQEEHRTIMEEKDISQDNRTLVINNNYPEDVKTINEIEMER